MKVLITGGTGFIGKHLTNLLVSQGHQVTVVTREPSRVRDGRANVDIAGWLPDLSPYQAVVHLAGEPILGKRWNDAQKERIRTSRITGTRELVAALEACDPRPGVLVSGSAIGYYGDRGDEMLNEEAPPGKDFLAGVCMEWEREAQAAADLGVRTVLARTGIVLGTDGGALAQMLLPFKLGIGGPIGRGRHWMSWIHLRDHARLILHALEHEGLSGPINFTTPYPVRNSEFSRTLGKVLRRPALLPVPPIALKLALGGVAEVVTSSQRCSTEKALGAGFAFHHGQLEQALVNLLER